MVRHGTSHSSYKDITTGYFDKLISCSFSCPSVPSNFPGSQLPPCCSSEDPSTGWAIWNRQFINGIWASVFRLGHSKFVIRPDTTTGV